MRKTQAVNFEILKKSKTSKARLGALKINKRHKIQTPCLAVVGTKASVKGVSPEELIKAGAQIVLANTYHLMLEPGEKVVKKMGGLRNFMGWHGPTMTDSGGFQVFSLGFGLDDKVGKIGGMFPGQDAAEYDSKRQPKFLKITEQGVIFESHKSGEKILLTPEKSIEVQEALGADIIFAFDECTSPLAGYEYTKKAMERTHCWAERCLKAKTDRRQALFGIAQGGAYKDLRKESAGVIGAMPFDGFGIGGSLGKSKKDMYDILDWIMPFLAESKPRHLLGIGDFEGIIEAVSRGVDLFDCVAPTREARNGRLYTRKGFLQIKNKKFENDSNPIEKDCGCYACRNSFSRAYIKHLLKAKEMLGMRLASIHNIYFMNRFFEEIRKNIGGLEKWGENFLKRFKYGKS